MKITLELNKRFGRGYQIHIIHPPIDSVYDAESLSLTDAGGHAAWMLEELNKQLGTCFEPYEVVSIAHDGLEANKDEFMSRRFLRDIETGAHELSRPAEQSDYTFNEKGEAMLSGRGVLIYAYASWVDDGKKDDKGAKLLRGYCRLLAGKGYGGGAGEIFRKIKGMELKTGIDWCKATYAKHVNSAEIMGLMSSL